MLSKSKLLICMLACMQLQEVQCFNPSTRTAIPTFGPTSTTAFLRPVSNTLSESDNDGLSSSRLGRINLLARFRDSKKKRTGRILGVVIATLAWLRGPNLLETEPNAAHAMLNLKAIPQAVSGVSNFASEKTKSMTKTQKIVTGSGVVLVGVGAKVLGGGKKKKQDLPVATERANRPKDWKADAPRRLVENAAAATAAANNLQDKVKEEDLEVVESKESVEKATPEKTPKEEEKNEPSTVEEQNLDVINRKVEIEINDVPEKIPDSESEKIEAKEDIPEFKGNEEIEKPEIKSEEPKDGNVGVAQKKEVDVEIALDKPEQKGEEIHAKTETNGKGENGHVVPGEQNGKNAVENHTNHNKVNGKSDASESDASEDEEMTSSISYAEKIKQYLQKSLSPNDSMESETATTVFETEEIARTAPASKVAVALPNNEIVESGPSLLEKIPFFSSLNNRPMDEAAIAKARQQPKSQSEEKKLQERYAAIEATEDRAFQILVDLGMVQIHSDLDEAGEWE